MRAVTGCYSNLMSVLFNGLATARRFVIHCLLDMNCPHIYIYIARDIVYAHVSEQLLNKLELNKLTKQDKYK